MHLQSDTFEDADWFALYRIARTLFLPVEPIMIFNPDIENRQNSNIKDKFGIEIVNYLNQVRKICQKHSTNIYKKADFFKGDIKTPNYLINEKDIPRVINGLEKGITNNLDYNYDALIHGDVRQFDSSLSKYAINYGAMGAVMAINRVKPDVLDNSNFRNWLKQMQTDVLEVVQDEKDYDIGLFSGLSGIALALFDLDETSIAEILFKKCVINHRQLDISLYSGVSGLGLANLSLYSVTKKKLYKNNAIAIAEEVEKRFDSGEFENQPDFEGKLSLIKGWAGAVLFLWKLGIALDKPVFKKKAIEILDRIVDKGIVDSDRGLSLLDKNKKIQRLLPYLDTGFAGITVLLIDMLIDDHSLVEKKYGKLFNSMKYDSGSFCSYCCSLFSGVTGLIVSSQAVKQVLGTDRYLKNYIHSLNNYVLSVDGNDILVPGVLGMKCSMDYETGASGLLITLHELSSNNGTSWYSWLPLLKDNKLNLFNQNPSNSLLQKKIKPRR